MGTLVAGVDSSTQACKVTVRDAATGRQVREGRAVHPEGTEVDPEAWWSALDVAIADAGGLDDVVAISIAAQQHGLVALDADGRIVRPALLWNDVRNSAEAAAIVDELGADAWAERVGVVPLASFTVAKLRWMRDHEPELAARIAAVALPHDWLSWRLRGYGPKDESPLGPVLDELATDGSDASGTGYWSAETRQYVPELFELGFGRPMRVAGTRQSVANDAVVVPRVCEPGEAMGETAADVLSAGITVGAGAGDNAAAGLAIGLTDGDVVVSIGTSGTVFARSSAAIHDASGTVAGFADATGHHLPITTTLNAARVLDVFADFLGVDHDGLAELASGAPAGADGLVLLPWLVGERTPNLPTATASLTGLTPKTLDRAHVARAAIEGMLCSLAEGLAAIEAAGVPAHTVHVIGGAAQNPAVHQGLAEILGRDVSLLDAAEYVAIGAARQAAWTLLGELPEWQVSGRRVSTRAHPEILETYRERARAAINAMG